MSEFTAPFPYFGGKSTIASAVWQRLGADVTNYVEPFAGSAAMLLKRPGWTPDVGWIETINDASGFVANFWRALQSVPDEVACYADWPVNENDLHARHAWLVRNHKDTLPALLEGDPDYYDAKVAGWWVWGMACWIGSGLCSGDGGWQSVEMEDGTRQLVHLGNAGQGECGTGEAGLLEWMRALSERFRRVRVCCGDWARVRGPTPTILHGTTAVFLDPPYSAEAGRDNTLYEVEDTAVANDCRAWALEWGIHPDMRIALCGYTGEHDTELNAAGWTALHWKAHGGYGSQGNGNGRTNAHREVVWFSPHCLKVSEWQQAEMPLEIGDPV
jgi:hypothetical protein